MPLPTPEEEAEFKRKYRESKAAKSAPQVVAPAPPPARRREVMTSAARGAASEAEMGLQSEEDKLLQQYIAEAKREQMMISDEEARRIASERLAAEKETPLYMGAFKPYEYKAPEFLPGPTVSRPQDIPTTTAPTFLEALAPQTRAGVVRAEKAQRQKTAALFNDAKFNEKIANLSPDEKREQLDAYEAYKAAFRKIRELNPEETTGVTDDDILKDIDRQLKSLGGGEFKTFVDDPANRMGYSGDPLARALQRQVTPSTPIPVLEPGQAEFVSTLDRLKRTRAMESDAAAAEKRLREQGVEIMRTEKRPTGERGPGGRPIMEDVQVPTGKFRPASEAEIQTARKNVAAYTDREMKAPLYAEVGKIDQFLKSSEEAAKGGAVFQKEYKSGATVESPTSWFVRAALSVPNALTGLVSEAYTPAEVEKIERANRPALYKDASAAIYNVAGSRGMMGEIGDLYEYAPETWTLGGKPLKEYATYAKAAGFAGDLIGFDLGLIGGAVTGARGAVAGGRAAAAAGEAAPAIARAAGRELALGSAKEFLDTIGLSSAASKIKLGDVRLQFGSALGDSYRAAAEYQRALDEGLDHAGALARAETRAPKAKFIDDAEKAGPAIEADLRSGEYFNGAPEWENYSKITGAVDDVRAGSNIIEMAPRLRPYIAAAVRETPEVADLLKAGGAVVIPGQARIKLSKLFEEVNKLPEAVKSDFYNRIEDAASIERGFTTIDRATKGTDPGRFTIRLTPTTFTTDDALDGILATVRETPEYKLVQSVTGAGPSVAVADDVGYRLTSQQTADLVDVLRRETSAGSLPRSQATKIMGNITSGVATGSDLRTVMNAVIDNVAAQSGQTFKSRNLAYQGMKDATVGGVTRKGVGVPSTRYTSWGKESGLMNSAWRKTADWIGALNKSDSSLSRFLSGDQLKILEDGKRKMGALGKMLETELGTLPKDMPLPEKIGQLAGDNRTPEFWRRVAQSAVFGKTDRSGIDLILGRFKYDDPLQFLNKKGRDALDELTNAYAKSGGSTLNDLPQFIDDVRSIVTNRDFVPASFIDKGGIVFDLKGKPSEVLAATWARKKADEIMDDTLSRIMDFEPDTIGLTSLAMRDVTRGMRTIDGRKVGDLPLSAAVAAKMTGKDISTVTAFEKLPGVKKYMAELDRRFGAGAGQRMIRGNYASLMQDVDSTAAALRAKYGGFTADPALIANEMKYLASGETTLGEVGGPLGVLLGRAIREDFGTAPKWNDLLSELGQLAESEAKGVNGAFRARRMIGNLLDSYNSFFYNAILSFNPRYHGVNITTAPFIGYSTTGRVPGVGNAATGAYVMARGSDPASRATVIAVDKVTGVPITAGDLFDATVKSGVFKSQAQAQLDSRFLDDAKKMGIATGMLKGEKAARNLVSLPAEFANFSDNAWRMSYVLDALDQGKTLDEALEVGRRSLYDYGSATEFERKYIARNVLFYNFFRNSLLESTRQALITPARFARQLRLTQDLSKMNVGEDKWNEMRWYTPYDAGISRVVLDFAPEAGKEGKITLLPQMPYYDAVYLASGLLSTPINMLRGQPDPVSGKFDFGSGYLFGKLSPMNQSLVATLAGADYLYDVRMKKDQMSVPHVALFDNFGLLPSMTSLLNLKRRPAAPGEEGYMGEVYYMSPDDFEKYKMLIKGAKLFGTERPIGDFGKWAASMDLFGDGGVATGSTESSTFTLPEAAGVTTQTKAGIPLEAETKAAEIEAKQMKEERKAATPSREVRKTGRPE